MKTKGVCLVGRHDGRSRKGKVRPVDRSYVRRASRRRGRQGGLLLMRAGLTRQVLHQVNGSFPSGRAGLTRSAETLLAPGCVPTRQAGYVSAPSVTSCSSGPTLKNLFSFSHYANSFS